VQQRIDNIKKAAKSASNIYIASDPDREGEAIG
jgi:DNA topoisomerase IA